MVKKLTTSSKTKKTAKASVNFFDLPISKQRAMITKAAKLSAQDQRNLLREYDKKFGKLQPSKCK